MTRYFVCILFTDKYNSNHRNGYVCAILELWIAIYGVSFNSFLFFDAALMDCSVEKIFSRKLSAKWSEFSVIFIFARKKRRIWRFAYAFSSLSLPTSLEGKNPRSSGAFRIIQQHALDHPSMEFSVDESLENALAGDLNDSEDFRRLGRWTEGVCKNTKYDRDRLQNVLQVCISFVSIGVVRCLNKLMIFSIWLSEW